MFAAAYAAAANIARLNLVANPAQQDLWEEKIALGNFRKDSSEAGVLQRTRPPPSRLRS